MEVSGVQVFHFIDEKTEASKGRDDLSRTTDNGLHCLYLDCLYLSGSGDLGGLPTSSNPSPNHTQRN